MNANYNPSARSSRSDSAAEPAEASSLYFHRCQPADRHLSPSQDVHRRFTGVNPAPSLGSRFAAIDHFRFLIDLVKAPCFAAFPSAKAREFIGFNVLLDAIINCAQEPISATSLLLSPNGDSWRR